MRDITELFTVDGQGILVPDAPVTVQLTDIEGESARDRSGMLHRTVLRRVRSWEFTYGRLTEEGLPVPATTAHHIKHRDKYPELQYKVSNGQALCAACHNRKHPEKGGRYWD